MRAFRVVFICFFLSGFTGLLYQTIWLRMALAHFGVNTAVVSTVLTVFMLGLALGTAIAGRWVERVQVRLGLRGLKVYAGLECLIGIGGLTVPPILSKGREILLSLGPADSLSYLMAGAAVLATAMLPFCVAMGCTFPAAMAYTQKRGGGAAEHAFSYLYLANVCGSVGGVLLPALVLIECWGFKTTLHLAAGINFFIALAAFLAGDSGAQKAEEPPAIENHVPNGRGMANIRPAAGRSDPAGTEQELSEKSQGVALFLTGFCSMGMEVVWTRIYPPFIGTFVYSFAAILATYLIATTTGSFIYRREIEGRAIPKPAAAWIWIGTAALLPLAATSVHIDLFKPLRIILGIAPFCALLGYLTPWLVDRLGKGNPQKMGMAYSLNLLGCILGPLAAGFVLIPFLGISLSSLLLALPFFIFSLTPWIRKGKSLAEHAVIWGLAVCVWCWSRPFERLFPKGHVRHDHTATVVAAGEGMYKILFINGVPVTRLTPITKMMVHLPMAHIDMPAMEGQVPAASGGRPPTAAGVNGLVICLGMGTSFRSLASWGGPATVVELVPSVAKFFPYFFSDADTILNAKDREVRIVVDDGRRFLDRGGEMFDLITIDPPPPVEAAGSSLLYSKEFYQSAIRRLKSGGILQAWIPDADPQTIAAVTRSLVESFASVRVFRSQVGTLGYHFLASQRPMPRYSAKELANRMPATAVRDMTEWDRDTPPEIYYSEILETEMDPAKLILLNEPEGGGPALTDDQPVNEFFFVRRYLLSRR